MSKEDQIVVLLQELIDRDRLKQRTSLGDFLNWAYRQGRAYKDLGFFNATVPAGTTAALTVTNTPGYIWIPHYEVIWVEEANITSLKLERDGQVFFDTMLLPAELLFNWTQIIPWFAFGVIKSTSTATIINTDIVDRWIISVWVATYVRAEEYNEFIDDLNLGYPRQWSKYGKG